MLLPGPPNAQVSKETEIHADSKPCVFLCTHYGLGAPEPSVHVKIKYDWEGIRAS